MATRLRLTMIPGFEKLLAADAAVQELEHERAEQAAAIARDLAPVESGDYRNGIEADGNMLNATDWKSHWIEWGSEHNPAHAVLRNAAAQVASRLVED